MTTYWITKYALTFGIKTLDSEKADVTHDGYLTSRNGSMSSRNWEDQYHFYGKKDWHRTKEEAIGRAEKMRIDKIESLKKQIAKLDKMKFT